MNRRKFIVTSGLTFLGVQLILPKLSFAKSSIQHISIPEPSKHIRHGLLTSSKDFSMSYLNVQRDVFFANGFEESSSDICSMNVRIGNFSTNILCSNSNIDLNKTIDGFQIKRVQNFTGLLPTNSYIIPIQNKYFLNGSTMKNNEVSKISQNQNVKIYGDVLVIEKLFQST